jgi:transcriptional regulator with XRE-family HTH domain
MSPATQIRHVRTRQLALTQRELAGLVGVDPMTVSRWERGKAEPGMAQLRRLAQLSEKPVAWFFEDLEEAVA